MQILAHNPEIQTYSNEEGHFITGFLIGTKPNEARWKISKRTGHNLVQKFIGKDFAIIPELITKPLSEGGGGHYFGQDTKEDLLRGYAENSHGKYVRVKGPYAYNDGTDDYYYNFDVKLRDSKAASELVKHGADTWIPYSHSPHIWPLAGPDDDIYDWEPIGGALVIKGAYGPQAVISKLCKGTAAQCEKSLGASSDKPMCEKKDTEIAQIISSLVSKSASIQSSMTENPGNAAPSAPEVKTLNADAAKPNAVVELNAQNQISNAPKIVSAAEFEAAQKEKAELQKQVKQLLDDKRNTELNGLLADFTGTTEEKVKTEFVEKWFKKEVDAKLLREFYNDILSIKKEKRKASEEEQNKEDVDKDDDVVKPEAKQAKTSKGASLPAETKIAEEDTTESKAASIQQENEVAELFALGGL